MKSLLLVISFLPFTTMLWAGNLFDDGNKFLDNKEFEKAIEVYEEYLKEHNDISAYYNLGIAYHSVGDHGQAIWAFESALKLDPSDQQVQLQINECKKEIDPSLISDDSSLIQSSIYSFSSTNWSILCILISILVALTIIIGFKAKQSNKRYTYYVISGLLILCTVLTGYFAAITSSFENQSLAIVIKEAPQLVERDGQFEPTQKFINAGTKVSITDEVGKGLTRIEDDLGSISIIDNTLLRELP